MTASLLEAVSAAAARSSHERERVMARRDLERDLERRRPAGQPFRASLAAPGVRVVAECKRRSPSRGVLRVDYDPAAIASSYEQAGAAAISVLTEPTFFDGSLAHLRQVRARVAIPLLCKDFVVTDYQVIEAAAAGADAVLLIVAALDGRRLATLIDLARSTGLAALVEVHDRDELSRALACGADIVGINSRNLRTLEVHPHLFDELGPAIPGTVVAVAESGLTDAAVVRRLVELGYDAFLIGERFMRDPQPGEALRTLMGEAARGRT
jgi:indole-3-glycerol phosphate synthase